MKMIPSSHIRRSLRICAVPFAALFAVSATAANISWNGSADAVWSTGGNWVGGVAPVAADTAVFDASSTANLPNTLGSNFSIQGLKITTPGGLITIGAGNMLTLGSGGIDMSGATQNLVLNALVALAANQSWDVANGRTLTANGAISGAFNLNKIGFGVLTLGGVNTFTGATTIGGGTLTLNGSLNGTTGTDLTFAGSGIFNVSEASGVSQGMKVLSFNGGEGVVRSTNNGGTSTVSFTSRAARAAGATGNFSLVNGTAGTPGNPGTLGTNNIAIGGGELTGRLMDRGLFYNGSSYAAYDAGGFVRGLIYGTDLNAPASIAAGATLGVNDATQDVQISGSITAQTTASVNTIRDPGAFSITLAGGQTLSLNGFLKSGGGAATISGGSGITTTASGNEMVIRTDAAGDSLTINTPILANGSSSLTKSGAGTLTLSAANTYTGGTFINAGTLSVSLGFTLGAAGFTNVTVQSGATLVMNRQQFTGSLTLNGATVLATDGFSQDTWNGPITLGATSTIDVGATDGVLTVNGNVSGPGGLTKLGTSIRQTVLNGINTYTGPTTITQGVLQFKNSLYGNDTTQWTPANISVASGATLFVNVGGASDFTATQAGTLFGSLTTVNNNGLKAGSSIGFDTGNAGSAVNISAAITNSSGAGGGAVGLKKYGAGTLQLSGANTFSGQIILDAGTLSLASFNSVVGGTASSNLGAPTTVANGTIEIGKKSYGGATILYTGTGETTDRVISFQGQNSTSIIDQSGTGLLKFTSAFNMGGSNKTIQLQGSTAGTGEIVGTIVNAASTAVTKSGSGIWILSGVNTYTGVTNISSGTLSVGTIGNGGVASNLGAATNAAANLVFGGGTLQYTGATASTDRGFTINAGTTATVEVTASNLTISGASAATTGALTKTGVGTLAFSGANLHTGGTNVNAGTLLLSGAVNMPAAGRLSVNVGGNFSLADGTARTTTVGLIATASLALATGSTLTFDWNDASLDLLSAAGTATSAGTVGIALNNTSPTGSGGNLITSTGASTLNSATYFLANNTNYYATITKATNSVSIGAQTAVTALTDAYWLGNQVTGAAGAMALASSTGTPQSNWASDAAGTSAGGVVPGGSAVNVIFGAIGSSQQASVTAGADMNLGSITFNDTAAVTIAGSNALTLNSTSATAATTSGALATVTAGSAISVTSFANATNTISAKIVLGADQTWNVASGKTLTVSGAISGIGSLTKADAGTLTLSGANNYTGATILSGGTLSVTTISNGGVAGGNLGAASSAAANLVFDGGTLQYTGSTNATNRSFTINTGKTATVDVTTNNLTLTGGSTATNGALTKIGNGTLTLSGANLHTGATAISAGTLQFAKTASLYNSTTASWTAANISVASGATLALNVGGFGEFTTGNVTTLLTNLGGLGGAVNNNGLQAGSNLVFDTASVTTFTVADNIADSTGPGGGAISLTKPGTNTLVLSGANTYTGLTTVTGGVLVLSNATALSGGIGATGGTSALTFNGGVLGLGNGNFTRSLAAAGTVTGVNFTGVGGWAAYTADRVVNLGGASGSITWATANTGFNGQTLILGAASADKTVDLQNPLDLGNAARTVQVDNGSAAIDGKLSGILSGIGGGLTKTGAGTLQLTGANTYTGTTSINVGVLSLGSGIQVLGGSGTVASIGPISFGGGTLQYSASNTTDYAGKFTSTGNNSYSIDTNGQSVTFASVIAASGTSGLTKGGTGTLTLSGANAYTGTTTINGGTLLLAGGNNTLNVNKPMVVNNGTLDLGSNSQYVGLFSGTGGSVTSTGGTLTIRQAGNVAASFAGAFNSSINLAIVRGSNNATSQFNFNFIASSPTTGTLTLLGGDFPTAQPSGFDQGVFQGISLKDAGRLTGVTAITLNGGTMYINNNASSTALNGGTTETSNQYLADRVNDAATITLNSGRIHFLGRASTNSTETLGAVTASTGMSTIIATPGGTGTNNAELTLTSLTRNDGAVLMVDSSILGTLGTAGSSNGRIFVNSFIGSNLTAVGTGVGIIPGVFRGTRGTSNIRPVGYVAAQGFVPVGDAGGPTAYTATLALAASTDNVMNPSAYVVATGGQTINSLLQSGNITFDATTPGTLTIASGMFLQTRDAAGPSYSIGSLTTRGTVTSGLNSGELFLIKDTGSGNGGTNYANKVHSVIADNGGTRVRLVVTNYNRENLLNQDFVLTAPNTYTGGTVYSGGNTLYLDGSAESSGVAPIPAAAVAANGLIINNSTVTMQNIAQQIAAANIVTLNGGSVLNLIGANNTLAGIVFNSNGGKGQVPTVTGGTLLTITGDIASTPTDVSTTPLIGTVPLDLAGTATHSITVTAFPQGNFVNTLTPLNGLTISSIIQNGGFTKKGTGVLSLTGVNTFAGQLTVEDGVISITTINNVSANGVLGNNALAVILGKTGSQTGTLEYTGTSATSTKPFTMASGGTGAFQVDAAATTLTLQGLMDGGGGLMKSGLGVLKLNGAVSNTYGGLTTVSAGELNLSRTAAANLIPGDIIVASGATLSESSNPNQIADTSAITLAGSYVLNSNSETIGALTINGGSVTTGSGVLTLLTAGNQLTMTGGTVLLGTAGTAGKLNLNGNVIVNSSPTIAAIYTQSSTPSTVDLNGGIRTFDVAAGTGAALGSEMTIAAPLTSPSPVGGGITKIGAGTLLLAGAGTYSGLTTVSAGTLAYGASDVIGAGAVTVNGATAILAMGANHSDSVGTVTLDGGASITGSGTSTLTSTGTFEMKSGSVSAGLAGTNIPLNKTTSGTVTLSGANSYSGATSINVGTLTLTGAGSLGNTAITVAGGATFAVKPGTTLSAGTTGTGALGASLALSAGSTFTMADNGIGIFNLQQNDTFASAGLVASVASGTAPTLTFDLGSTLGAIDVLNVTKGVTTGLAVKGQINFTPLTGLSSLATGPYPFITAASGLGPAAFTLNTTFLVVGSNAYSLSLATSDSAHEILTISAYAGSASIQKFDRVTPASPINARPGATFSMAGTLSNIGAGNLNVSLTSTGTLSVTSLASSSNPVVNGTPGNITGTISTSATAGIRDWQVTNTDGSAANPTSTIGGTVNFYDLANAKYTGGTLAFGNVHKLATAGTSVAFGNQTVTDATFQDLLNVSATTGNANVTAAGFTGLAASTGGTTTNNLTFSINTATEGSLASTPTLTLTSNANGVAGLSNGTATPVGSPAAIAITGQVYSGLMIWGGTSGGNWITDANWNDAQSASVHAAPGLDAGFTNVDTATFGNTAGPVTINLSGATPSLNALTFNSTGSYTIAGASAITMAGTTPAITAAGTQIISAPVTLGSNLGITVSSLSDALTIGGNISGTGFGLSKAGAGTLVLGGTNTYTGTTTLSAGTLSLGSSSAIGSGALTIAGGTLDSATANLINTGNNPQNWNGNFAFAGTNSLNLGTGAVTMSATRTVTVSANTLTVGGNISGTGFGLTKLGSGTLVLGGTNTFTGAATLSAGTLSVGANANLGNANALIFDGGTLQITGTALTSYAAGLIGTHAVTQTADKTVGFDISAAGNTFSVNQPLSQGIGGLTKLGAGTLALTSTNTYTGATMVNAGTLVVNGTLSGSATTVNSGGTLAGDNGALGAVTVNSGGIFSPGGGGIGALTVNGTLALSAASIFSVQFDSTNTATDGITVNGALTIAIGAVLDLSDIGTNPSVIYGIPASIITYSGALPGTFLGLPDDSYFTSGGRNYLISYNGADPNNSQPIVTLTMLENIPEPGAVVSLLGGLGMLLSVRRRRA